MVARTPGLSETVARSWRKAARFYTQHAIADAEFRLGVPPGAIVVCAGAGVDDRGPSLNVDGDLVSPSRGGTAWA